MAMSVRRGGQTTGGRTAALCLVTLVYAFVLAAGPLLHHDITCELKSRTHCVICVSGVAGPGLADASDPPILDLPRAGWLPVARTLHNSDPCTPTISGRSPPAASFPTVSL